MQTLKQTSVTSTLCVKTQRDSTSAAVLAGIREMVETAQVNVCYIYCKCGGMFTTQSYNCNISAFVMGFPLSCGPNEYCLESGGCPVCECSPGFEGAGYVCAGSILFSVAFPLSS